MKKHEQKYLDGLAKLGQSTNSLGLAKNLRKTGRATLKNLRRLEADGYVKKVSSHSDPLLEEYVFIQRPTRAINERQVKDE